MFAAETKNIFRRAVGENVWLSRETAEIEEIFVRPKIEPYKYEVLETEEAVGRAMLEELKTITREKSGDATIILLGGRGAQAMYRQINQTIPTGELDEMLAQLHVFTQDALAPLRMDNALSFVRDFERLLGAEFFRKVKSFTPIETDTENLEDDLIKYLEKLESLGGIDLFFLGLGPEANAASHLAYIKPNSGGGASDVAGIIPISQTILEHHIGKFKAGGSAVSEPDEAETRRATRILTLAPAAILGAKRVVQSIVDASTAPAKRESFRRIIDTNISDDLEIRAAQMDENPGLWLRLHPNVRTLLLPDLFH
jgi:6-phosphogluconolactonase/glucosamine-6-phosphate isomerase/deaminase